MFLGEFDFNDIFHNEVPEESLQYESAYYPLFIVFLVLMAIIIMNLLVSDTREDQSKIVLYESMFLYFI